MRWRVVDHVEILQDQTFTVVGLFASGDPRLATCEDTVRVDVFELNSQRYTIAEHR